MPEPLFFPLPIHPAPIPAPIPAPVLNPIPAPIPIPAPLPAPPQLLGQPALPLPAARHPFDPLWPIHNLGNMDVICTHCGALHWMAERLSSSTNTVNKFGGCCLQGKIALPPLHNLPPELFELYTSQDPPAKAFREHIRNYNNALAMTSTGCTVDDSLNRQGGGPWLFKLHGKLSHRSGSLIPREGASPQYAQLYIYDPQDALDYRMNHPSNHNLNRDTMAILQDMLFRRHPGVAIYKQAHEITRDLPMDQCKIALRFDEECDRRRYNLPTAASNEIAVVVPGDGEVTGYRDIVLHRRDAPMETISECHPWYHALHYVLLFPTGQLGWHPKIQYVGGQNNEGQENAALELNDENPAAKKRNYVSMAEYFAYRIHKRQNQTLHIFQAGKLFQEFLVDCWALAEQLRLNWVTF